MEFNGWNSFDDLARACGYNTCHKDSNTTNESNNFENMGCNDIPNGFQSLNPELFIIIGEILGNIVAGSLPFNVQNAIGNWLQLVGQAILTYNAQQQYFQTGPGRDFNPIYYNVANPFCSNNSTSSTQNTNSTTSDKNSNKNKQKSSNSNSKDNIDKINSLELQIKELTTEIQKLKNKLNF